MRYIINFAIIIILLLFNGGCENTPPEPDNGPGNTGMLIVEDVGVTDAVLRLRVPHSFLYRGILLKRDTSIIFALQASSIDTLIIDDKLLPKRPYKYTLTLNDGFGVSEHYHANIITMDTTSHEFTWKIDALGNVNSSHFDDVAILNDTQAFAVGAVYMNDSAREFEVQRYGLAKWDGKSWQLKKLLARSPNGYFSNLIPRGIFAISSTDIWIASGGVHQWNGVSDTVTPFWINNFQGNPTPIWGTDQFAEKLWGTSSNNIYATGSAGALAHYDGNQWSKIESGTTLNILDIWGDWDNNGQLEILALASEFPSGFTNQLISIRDRKAYIIPCEEIPYSSTSVWFESKKIYYVSGSGVWRRRHTLNDAQSWLHDMWDFTPLYYSFSIRGQGMNDIAVTGGYGEVVHYNGYNARNYLRETILPGGNYYKVAIRGNIIMAVGQDYGEAVVAIGRR